MAIWKTKWGYRAEYMDQGKRIRAKGFFKYKSEAQQWVKSEKENQKNNQSTFSQDDLHLWKLSQEYLADCKINYSKNTFDEKKFCLERLYKHLGDVIVTEIEPIDILKFINDRAESQSNNAANKDRKNIKAFYSWLRDYYGILYDPTAAIRKKSHSKKSRRIISIADILKVILVAQGHDRVMIETYWHTGGRRSEIKRLTWEDDINFEERWIRLGTKKSRDGSMVYEKLAMNDDLYKQLIWQWNHRHPTSPYVFCHMDPKSPYYGQPYAERWRFIKNLCEKAGVQEFNYHDIRHTVAKYLNDINKVGIKKVQQVLRHKRQSTTEIYVEGNYNDTQATMSLLEIENLQKFR
ncbi:MAG: site-specific integrase [Pseudomonadota bacterium]